MSGSVERRPDGSFALFIDGDLQFDSQDEHIYHEGLVLPGLLAAQKRCDGPLDVLIIGGGDGLSAREILKSDSINRITLVDYDPEIVQMSLGDFSKLNQSSMADPKLTINCTDAWEFVEEALNDGEQFDLIVVDLTVAADADGARFHSIDWYENLYQLLSPNGVMSVNGVSPHQTPLAYWSIFNSMVKAQLMARPYRVAIPSFFSRGYGSDWGFFLAAKNDISQDEIHSLNLENIEQKQFLTSLNQLKEMFFLPEELYPLQKEAQPALEGSEILIRYFHHGALTGWTGKVSDSLLMNLDDLSVPEADTGREVLPIEISTALANAITFQTESEIEEFADPKQVLGDVLRLMPSLEPSQTPDMLADFLSDPGVFLRSVDLSALISRILKRAGSLPPQLVAELKLLSIKLADWTGDQLSLMRMGRNVVTLLALLMVIGNLLYPDMVYAKGDGGRDGARAGDHRGNGEYRDRDGRRRRGDGAWWNEGTSTWVYDDVQKRGPGRVQNRVPELEIKEYGGGNKGNNSAKLPQSTQEPIQDKEQTRVMLTADLDEAVSYQNLLKDELGQYMLQDNSTVSFGMHDISRDEAIRLTQRLIDKNSLKIAMLNGLITNLDEA